MVTTKAVSVLVVGQPYNKSQPLVPLPVLFHGTVMFQMQNEAFSLTKLQGTSADHSSNLSRMTAL